MQCIFRMELNNFFREYFKTFFNTRLYNSYLKLNKICHKFFLVYRNRVHTLLYLCAHVTVFFFLIYH